MSGVERQDLTAACHRDGAFHQALEVLQAAAQRTRTGVVCLAVPLAPEGRLGWSEQVDLGAARHKAFVLAQHLRLVRRAKLPLRSGHPVLVREFSTLPLWLVAPALYRWRSRLLFVVNHNLQWALNQRSEAWAFRRLHRAGFRFAFFETMEAPVLREWGFERSQHVILRHPVPDIRGRIAASASDRPFIGLAGHFRPEKGMIEALRVLDGEPKLRERIAIGLPNPPEFLRAYGAGRKAVQTPRLFHTASDEDFRAFLARCGVIVLNYAARDYAWRPSGLMADCAAAGTPVVIPDLPVQREQLQWPTPIGEVFQELEELPRAVFQALEKGAWGGYGFDAYRAARGIAATAAALDAIWTPPENRTRGTPGRS